MSSQKWPSFYVSTHTRHFYRNFLSSVLTYVIAPVNVAPRWSRHRLKIIIKPCQENFLGIDSCLPTSLVILPSFGINPSKMDKAKLNTSNLELPPLRTLDDFVLESARFQIPNFRDLDKWNNRVVQNLLYYQTNYFFMAIIIFFIVGLIHPGKMLLGMIAMAVVLVIFAYVSTEGRAVYNFKKKNPMAGLIVIVLGTAFVAYTLGSLLVFLVGILLPFCVTFIHASLRLRSIKNKVVNKIEGIGLKRTPMGVFLEQLDDVSGIRLRAQPSNTLKPHH
ncbi:PRA1 family protein 3 isoform X2 [Diachasmimorpha longicaudata]|uniref:PRA1 family protein 3 isoform X2 n=1 Tax=Diachasmimorpha longicaudata TaxID=58733 RepID=UPI0030B8D395